jgi:hypothetical protein
MTFVVWLPEIIPKMQPKLFARKIIHKFLVSGPSLWENGKSKHWRSEISLYGK